MGALSEISTLLFSPFLLTFCDRHYQVACGCASVRRKFRVSLLRDTLGFAALSTQPVYPAATL